MDAIGNVISGIVSAPLVCCMWLIVGALAGAFARRIMGAQDRPIINDIILGLIGSVVGGFLVRLFGIDTGSGGITGIIISVIVATVGAMALIMIGRLLRGGRR